MAARLSLPAVYSWQPQTVPIIASGRLTQGLVEAIIPVSNGAKVVSVPGHGITPTGQIFTDTGANGRNPSQGVTKYGATRFYGNSGTGSYDGYSSRSSTPYPFNTSLSTLKEVSMLSIFRASTTPTATTFWAALGNSGTDNPIFAHGVSSSGTKLVFSCRDTAGTSQATSGALTLAANTDYLVITTRSESANFTRYYINGALDLSTTASALGSVSFNRTALGTLLRSGSLPTGGHVNLAAYWNRALQPDEAANLFANPWQIFEYPSRPIFIDTVAAAATVMPPPLLNIQQAVNRASTY